MHSSILLLVRVRFFFSSKSLVRKWALQNQQRHLWSDPKGFLWEEKYDTSYGLIGSGSLPAWIQQPGRISRACCSRSRTHARLSKPFPCLHIHRFLLTFSAPNLNRHPLTQRRSRDLRRPAHGRPSPSTEQRASQRLRIAVAPTRQQSLQDS